MTLFEENNLPEVISWDDDGLAFQIRDPLKLAENVLPKLYKYTRLELFYKKVANLFHFF